MNEHLANSYRALESIGNAVCVCHKIRWLSVPFFNVSFLLCSASEHKQLSSAFLHKSGDNFTCLCLFSCFFPQWFPYLPNYGYKSWMVTRRFSTQPHHYVSWCSELLICRLFLPFSHLRNKWICQPDPILKTGGDGRAHTTFVYSGHQNQHKMRASFSSLEAFFSNY